MRIKPSRRRYLHGRALSSLLGARCTHRLTAFAVFAFHIHPSAPIILNHRDI